MRRSLHAVMMVACLVPLSCTRERSESQPAGRDPVADAREFLEQVAEVRSYVLEWKVGSPDRPRWARSRVMTDGGKLAVNEWLKENREAVKASQVALDIAPEPDHLLAILPDGREVYIQLLTSIPVGPKVNPRWKDALPREEIERLVGMFKQFGVSAEAAPLELGCSESVMAKRMKATGARDVTAMTRYKLDRAISGHQKTYWWEYPDQTVVGIGLAGEGAGDLRVITIEIGEPGKGVAGIEHWRSQRLVCKTSMPAGSSRPSE